MPRHRADFPAPGDDLGGLHGSHRHGVPLYRFCKAIRGGAQRADAAKRTEAVMTQLTPPENRNPLGCGSSEVTLGIKQ